MYTKWLGPYFLFEIWSRQGIECGVYFFELAEQQQQSNSNYYYHHHHDNSREQRKIVVKHYL